MLPLVVQVVNSAQLATGKTTLKVDQRLLTLDTARYYYLSGRR